MNLKSIFLPWLVIAKLREDVADEIEATTYWQTEAHLARREISQLRAQIAPMDHDGDGRIGGSLPNMNNPRR